MLLGHAAHFVRGCTYAHALRVVSTAVDGSIAMIPGPGCAIELVDLVVGFF